MMTDLIEKLKDLGMTEYESKVYIALLAKNPATGYEVAKVSGVPRSKVYEALESLVEQGAATASYGEPVRYAPTDPAALIASVRSKVNQSLDYLQDTLPKISSLSVSNPIWDIEGREHILQKAYAMIARAQRGILLEVWAEDAHLLQPHLQEAHQRGVKIMAVSYGQVDWPFAKVYNHGLQEEITRGFGARWIVLSIDMTEVLVGNVSLGERSRAAWTEHQGLVRPVTELIKHDIFIREILDQFGEALASRFGPDLVWLREQIENFAQPES